MKTAEKTESTSPPGKKDKRAYEDRLRDVLSEKRFGNLALVVTDRDLSGLDDYPGLSEATVSKVATERAVAVCIYAAGKDASLLERHKSGGDQTETDRNLQPAKPQVQRHAKLSRPRLPVALPVPPAARLPR